MPRTLAFFGAGPQAGQYLDALARRPDVAVAAVCDLDRRAAEQTAAGWGARVFLSYEAMLEEVQPEALWVCVPPPLQGHVLLKAAERGVPFFVDPPGALDYPHARLCARLVQEKKLVTAVGFPTGFTDVVREAREYLGANPVPLALGRWLWPASTETVADAAGLLWTDGCRLIDALRHFCGEVKRVHAQTAGTARGGLVVQLEFANGGVGVLTCATFARPEPRVELELMGEGWCLEFGATAAAGDDPLAAVRLVERDRTTILRRMNNPAADHAAAFLEAVAANDPQAVPTGYAAALGTLTVCHAAALSARESRPVELAEV